MEEDCLDWACFTDGVESRLECDLGGDLGGEMICIKCPFEYKELNIRTEI